MIDEITYEEIGQSAYKEQFEKEAKICAENWSRVGMLQGIKNEYIKKQMALLFENQRLINETLVAFQDIPQFKRVSIPLVRRTFDPSCCLIWDLVSLQTMLKGKVFAFYENNDVEDFIEVEASTKIYASSWDYTIKEHYSLDKEAEKVAITAIHLCNGINKEVIDDLMNSVSVHKEIEWQGADCLWNVLDNFTLSMGKKPTWMITNKLLAAELKKVVNFNLSPAFCTSLYDYVCTGIIDNKIKLIECESFENEILVGYKGGPHEAGYVYMPYVPFSPIEKYNILTKYNKRLLPNGANFYARLTVNGYNKE